MRILIAEDDRSLARFLKKGMEAEHHAVDIAHDGEEACSHGEGVPTTTCWFWT